MERTRIVSLLYKHQQGQLTQDEEAELERWAASYPPNRDLMGRVASENWLYGAMADYDRILPTDDRKAAEQVTNRIRKLANKKPAKLYTFRRWLPYVAVVALAVAFATWRYTETLTAYDTALADILPGGNRATLMFADGEAIALSDEQTGIVLTEGKISYVDGTPLTTPATDTLVLATPTGGIYQVRLPDGSKVWLNAASTLKYPLRFDGERLVELSGEGYFEIEKDAGKPFRVLSQGQQVTVLGTTFNIAAYPDDAETRTTLIEGKVHVRSTTVTGGAVVLAPSEQAVVIDGYMTKSEVDVQNEVAWRQGLFAFRGEKLNDIMRQVARWYNVDVVFKDEVGNRTFSGTVSRYANISEVLETLSLTDKVSFEVQGTTILAKSKK